LVKNHQKSSLLVYYAFHPNTFTTLSLCELIRVAALN